MQKAILFEKKKDFVRCLACANYCAIKDGEFGKCGVRKNVLGELFLTVYGRAVAANIDPMEKKPLFHFMPSEQVFSIGTVGCNYKCDFCQNWEISQSKDAISFYLPPEEIVDYCLENGIKAIAFTYNEPTIFIEYCLDTIELAKKHGIKTVFVSNGYESKEALDALAGKLDAINIDLKSFSDSFYKKHCAARLQPVLDTIRRCHSLGIWVEVTTLLIPYENDSEDELRQIAEFISSIDINIPWHVSAFHPDYKLTNLVSTERASLIKAYDIGKQKLNHVYVGNIDDTKRSSTYCAKCGTMLIKRQGYHIEILAKERCPKCKEKIPITQG